MRNIYPTIKCLLLICFCCLFAVSANAQTTQVTGKVTDAENGSSLPAVNVLVKGTTLGTITDANGAYSLAAPSDGTLVFSSIGYTGKEIAIEGRATIDLSMNADVTALNEIVVVGYGTQEKRNLVGAYATISSERIATRPVASAEQALAGLTPGINVAQPGASPGDLATINIRGIGSISAGYSPLFVIDGYPTDQRNFAAINPRDIESMEVLKDASATAIYGSRGANGVIIVTTKSAKEGKSQINVGLSTGFAEISQAARPKLLNAQEYVEFYTEAQNNRGLPIPSAIANWDGKTQTNWQDVVYRKAAFSDLNISATGGNDKVSYLISGNYIDQQGTVIGEGQKKYSTRVKVDYRPNTKMTFGIMIAPNVTDIYRGSPAPEDGVDQASANSLAYLLPPIVPLYKPDGSFGSMAGMGYGSPLANPLELSQEYKRTTRLFRILANTYGSIELAKGLVLKSSLGLNFGSDKTQTLYDAPGPRTQLPAVSSLSLGQGQQSGWLSETLLTYKKIIGDHSFDLLGGYTAQSSTVESLNANVSSLSVIGPTLLSLGSTTTLTATNGVSTNTLTSLLGRVNYSYKGKYLLTGTIRQDGSSRFGANNRTQAFGSIAAGWILSEENFMKSIGFISNAKIRGSYGSTGSNSIPDYIARPSLTPINQAFGATLTKGVINGDPGNPNLTWETSNKLDIGLDLSILKNRINFVFDYYDNKTTNLLLSKNLVTSSGYAGTLLNIGSMDNSGFEVTVQANVLKTNDWSVSVGGNATHNSQKVTSLGGDQELFNFFGALRTRLGGELQQPRGVKAIGVVRQSEVGNLPAQPNVKAGDIKYQDYDGNGTISDFLGGDGQLFGDSNIDWLYGVNATVRYKNFELFTLLNGQSGGYVYDFYLIQVGDAPTFNNVSKTFWYDGRYISEAQPGDGKTPRAGASQLGNPGVAAVSTLGVQKTDYVRIRNISLTYNIPATFSEKYGIRNARLYASVENFYTFTNFIGGNPDARRNSIGGPGLIGGSRLAGTSDGRELGLTSVPSLPLPRTWTLGINFSF